MLEMPISLFSDIDKPHRIQIVGNLPFGVASVILLNILRSFSAPATTPLSKLFSDCANLELLFMFQKEVARVRRKALSLLLENSG